VSREDRAASLDPDVEKNVRGASQHEIRGETKGPKHQPFQETASAKMRGISDHFNQCSYDSEPPASERHN
jgi:hypothetical protein